MSLSAAQKISTGATVSFFSCRQSLHCPAFSDIINNVTSRLDATVFLMSSVAMPTRPEPIH